MLARQMGEVTYASPVIRKHDTRAASAEADLQLLRAPSPNVVQERREIVDELDCRIIVRAGNQVLHAQIDALVPDPLRCALPVALPALSIRRGDRQFEHLLVSRVERGQPLECQVGCGLVGGGERLDRRVAAGWIVQLIEKGLDFPRGFEGIGGRRLGAGGG